MKMNKKNLTAEQKKAARAAYAKAYYEKMKAKKAGTAKPESKTEPKKNTKKATKKALADGLKAVKKLDLKKAVKKTETKKVNVKKAAKKTEVKKVNVKKAAKKNIKKVEAKFSMKPAQKLLDQIKKPLGIVRKLTKAYGKLMTETLKSKDASDAARIVKLFSYSGFEFDPTKGVVTVSINGKVKIPAKKDEVNQTKKDEVKQVDVVKTAKKRGRKPKADKPVEEDAAPDPIENAEPIIPVEKPAEATDEIIPPEADVNGSDEEDEDEEIEDTSRDRDLDEGTRDYHEALAETEEAMQDNGDWDN